MRIAVDAMGGDNAPEAVVAGALEVADRVERLLLVGEPDRLTPLLEAAGSVPSSLELVPSGPALGNDESPVAVLKKRADVSIRVAVELAAAGEVDAVLSAGHTGGLVAAASTILKPIKGVRRTPIAVNLPTLDGGSATVLDVGATIKCRASHLFQFGVMGQAYVRTLKGIESPRVGLLNMGREQSKGSDVVQRAGQLLADGPFDYVGFVEGEEVFGGGVDVVVCEGFVGNVLLKVSEGLMGSVQRFLDGRLSTLVDQPAVAEMLGTFRGLTDYAEHGGAPLLGVRTTCVICHGKSDAKAIASAILAAARLVELQQPLRRDLERYRVGRFGL